MILILWTNGKLEPTFSASQRIVLAGGLQFLIKGGQRSIIYAVQSLYSAVLKSLKSLLEVCL